MCILSFLLAFFGCIFWTCCSFAADTPDDTQIGVIQYNVKGGQGGWTTSSGILSAQIGIIEHQINSAAVDFIALEQATEMAGLPSPLISDPKWMENNC
jgi:hypothetical protein